MIIKGVLRDGPSPAGNALDDPNMSDGALKVHVAAGRIRRLYAECKALTASDGSSSTSISAQPARMDWEGAPPPPQATKQKNVRGSNDTDAQHGARALPWGFTY